MSQLAGGVFDIKASAKIVLNDWNQGKIPYYTIPPEVSVGEQISSSVVSSWGDAFKFSSVVQVERDSVLNAVDAMRSENLVFAPALVLRISVYISLIMLATHHGRAKWHVYGSSERYDHLLDTWHLSIIEDISDDDDGDQGMEIEKKGSSTGQVSVGRIRATKRLRHDAEPAEKRIHLDEQAAAELKKKGETAAKKKRQEKKLLDGLNEEKMEVEGGQQSNENYDFGADFWA